MSLEDVRLYSKLDAIFAFDDEIGVGVVVPRVVAFCWQSHRGSEVELIVRLET